MTCLFLPPLSRSPDPLRKVPQAKTQIHCSASQYISFLYSSNSSTTRSLLEARTVPISNGFSSSDSTSSSVSRTTSRRNSSLGRRQLPQLARHHCHHIPVTGFVHEYTATRGTLTSRQGIDFYIPLTNKTDLFKRRFLRSQTSKASSTSQFHDQSAQYTEYSRVLGRAPASQKDLHLGGRAPTSQKDLPLGRAKTSHL